MIKNVGDCLGGGDSNTVEHPLGKRGISPEDMSILPTSHYELIKIPITEYDSAEVSVEVQE